MLTHLNKKADALGVGFIISIHLFVLKRVHSIIRKVRQLLV